jgi:GST-like protein
MAPVLYHGGPNGPSLTVLAALEESGLAIEMQDIRLIYGERHTLPGVESSVALDFAVEGEGPVLVIDGEAMSESVFLAQYFDEAAGGCGLQPDDPFARWEMRMWCRQVTERLAPASAYLGNLAWSQRQKFGGLTPEERARMLAPIRSVDLRERWQELLDGIVDDAKVSDSKAKVAQFADRIEQQLGDGREWLMGAFSIADLETFAWVSPMKCLERAAFEGRARCGAWLDRVEARPCVAAVLDRVNDGDPITIFAPGPEINRWG